MYSVSIALQLAFLKYISIYSIVVLKLTFPFLWFFYLFNICASILLFCRSICLGRWFMYACEHVEALHVSSQILSLPAGLDCQSRRPAAFLLSTEITSTNYHTGFLFSCGWWVSNSDPMLTPAALAEDPSSGSSQFQESDARWPSWLPAHT